MNRQNIFKNNSNNIIKMETNNIMNVEDFFKKIEKDHEDQAFYRYINVFVNDKGKKQPIGEKNNLNINGIYNDRGKPHYNTLSLAVKYVQDLYVIDFDTKEVNGNLLFFSLKDDNVAYTETKKGYHFYVKIKNIGKYSNQQKIYYQDNFEVDLIKTNNIWETKDRNVVGEIKEYDWNELKFFFNTDKMNFKESPPVTPTTSDEDEVIEFVKPKREYDAGEIQDILNILPQECFEYSSWTEIGMAISNVTEGDDIGLGLYVNWSKKDEDGFDINVIKNNWKYWKKKTDIRAGMTTLRKLKEKYSPRKDQSLQTVYKTSLQDEEFGKGMREANIQMLKEMNNRLIFVKETGDYIILDKKLVKLKCGSYITKDCWYLKSPNKARDHFKKEIFNFSYKIKDEKSKDDDEESFKWKSITINPFNKWCEWIDRREVRAIGFDPTTHNNDDIFNLWNGFNISKEVADNFDEKQAEPILNVIKDIWCKGDMNAYNYILNYFSHVIQKPHIKMGVLLALKSKQGGMKGIILNKLAEIIGDDHYAQNSNASFLFGDFNGQLEGKILINLDEAFWGGDKKLEGIVKNRITESRQTINKKNKEMYNIDDYANYIITTNNDWFAGTTEDDRRHFCIELDNRMAGRMTPEKMAYIQPVLDAPCEAFAKILYNRDIEDFVPREFKKTQLLQDQVERNWSSVKVWYNNVMKDGGFTYKNNFIEWNEIKIVNNESTGLKETYGQMIKSKKGGKKIKKIVYTKNFIYRCYESQVYDNKKFCESSFWRDIQKHCLCELYEENRVQIEKQRILFVFLPSLDEARERWNIEQQYDYNYTNIEDDWEECDSSDEE
jgi:hypothetical protein